MSGTALDSRAGNGGAGSGGAAPGTGVRRTARLRAGRVALHTFLALVCLVWLAPLLWAVFASLRSYGDTSVNGYFSVPRELTLDNFSRAWNGADLPHYFLNSLVITIPAVVVTLLFSSFVAYGVTRYSFRFNLVLLMVFTAGNLLPQQVVITPLYRLFLLIPVPEWLNYKETLLDTQLGLVLVHIAFQAGFCTFVLSNYMKTIPAELTEAARVDGAGVFRQYWQVVLPLCRPAIGALATLEFTWVYNDYFWAIVLIQTGDKMPVMSALSNLRGQYLIDYNLLAAGSLLVAVPCLVVFFALQRQFIGGLTLGSTKG